MKTFTTFFLFMVAAMSYAALPKIDFETVGNTWSWSVFETAPVWSVVPNPSKTGINTSDNVGKLEIKSTDAPWAGVQCGHGDFGPFTLTQGNSTIKIMVYKDVISPVGIKLVTSSDWAQPEIKMSNTKINEWEELTFDFSAYIGIAGQPGPYDRIVFFTDFPASRTAGSVSYIDNIVYDVSAPDTEKPTAFTASAGITTATDVVLKLNATDNSGGVKYTIAYGTTVLYTTGTSGVEKLYTVTGLTPATAYTFNVSCADASGNTALNNPIAVSASTATAMAEAPTPKKAAADVISLFSDAYTNVSGADFFPNWGQSTKVSDIPNSGNATKKYENFNYQGITFATPIDAGTMTSLHLDIYPTTETTINISPINTSKAGALKEGSASVGTLIPNQWNSIDIPLAAIGVDMSAMDQFIFKGGTGGSFYLDNLYLWKEGAPMPAAPTPTKAANNVISVYSDAYTNLQGTDFFPNWGQSTVVAEVPISGNGTKVFSNFNYQGFQLAAPVNASSMTSLHLDVYPTTETVINISPINTSKTGAEKEGSASLGTLVPNQWNSVDILLSSIGVDMSAVDQFIFKGGTNGMFYLDNLYFWKTGTGFYSPKASMALNCYPNPMVNKLTISAQTEIHEIIVRNIVGQSVKSEMVNAMSKTLDVSDLLSGNYFVVAKMSNGEITTQKISKQ